MNLDDIDGEAFEKSSTRIKANNAKKLRSRSLICVLENPSNLQNIASVIRNIDALGVTKLYVVSSDPKCKIDNKSKKKLRSIRKCSSSADKYVYVRYFDTTQECFDYLEKKKFKSLVTSPHIKGKNNYQLYDHNFKQYRRLAVWFGNESKGISDEIIRLSKGCVQIRMAGIVESMNLSVATGIVLSYISHQRRKK